MAEVPASRVSNKSDAGNDLKSGIHGSRSGIPVLTKKSCSSVGITFPTEKSLMSSSPSHHIPNTGYFSRYHRTGTSSPSSLMTSQTGSHKPSSLPLPTPSPSTAITQPPPSSITQPPAVSITQPPPTSITQPPPTSITQSPPTSITQPPPMSITQSPPTSITQPSPASGIRPPNASIQPPPTSITQPPPTTGTRPPPTTITQPPPTTSTQPPPTSITQPPPTTITQSPPTRSPPTSIITQSPPMSITQSPVTQPLPSSPPSSLSSLLTRTTPSTSSSLPLTSYPSLSVSGQAKETITSTSSTVVQSNSISSPEKAEKELTSPQKQNSSQGRVLPTVKPDRNNSLGHQRRVLPTVKLDGSSASTVVVQQRSTHDEEVRKNLLEMISKSAEKKSQIKEQITPPKHPGSIGGTTTIKDEPSSLLPSVERLTSGSVDPEATDNVCGSESVQQTNDRSDSSSSETDVRNLVPLSLEMEDKESTQFKKSTNYIPGSSEELITGSEASLRQLSGAIDPLVSISLEEASTMSLPDLEDQSKASKFTHGQMKPSLKRVSLRQPQGQRLGLKQLSALQSEKIFVESQLSQAQSRIDSLEIENKNLRAKVEKSVANSAKSAEEYQKKMATLLKDHAEEVTQVKKQMRQQLESERKRLLNQIRELTIIKEQANAEVDGLKESLSDAQELANNSTNSLEKFEAKHQMEVESLKVEIQALQELHHKTEAARSSLLKSNKRSEEKANQLFYENKMLKEKLSNGKLEEGQLKSKLRAAELHFDQLLREKCETLMEVEQKAIADSTKMQVEHREAIDDIQKQLDDAKATIIAQNQRLQHLQGGYRGSSLGDPRLIEAAQHAGEQKKSSRIWKKKREPMKTAPMVVSARYLGDTIAFKNKRHAAIPMKPGNEKHERCWSEGSGTSLISEFPSAAAPTAENPLSNFPGRKLKSSEIDPKKHAEEMLHITRMLEGEGYGKETTMDEVIHHLWWTKEHAKEELQKANETLKKMMSEKQFNHLQEWQRERKELEDKLKMAQQSQSANEKVAKLKQEALKQKLEGILQKSHDESRSNSLQQKQHGDVLSENTTLKHRLSDLQGKLYTKDVEMSHLEGDLAGSKREVSYAQQELALERQQKDAMKTKMNTLEHQLRDRERVLSDIQDAADVIVANNDPAQQKELASLKAKYVVKLMQVGELEGENSVLQQQLNFIAEQRDTLEADLDTSNTHIAALEAQVVKERSVASEARTAIDSLRDEYILKQEDIQREKLHCGELERDVVTLRKDLKSSQLNVSSLQNELITLQDENERCNADLSKMSNHAADMERKLLATTESLRNFQNLSTKCQESITAAQLDLKRVKSKLEAEKQTNTQLQAEVNSLTEDLESSERRVEGRNAQYTQTRTDLSRKTVELQELQQANHSLKVEIGQLQAVSTALQGDLEVRDTTVKSLERELAQTKEVLSATKQQLGVSNRDVTTCKRQIEEYQVQLNESDTETAKLMRDVKICGNEIQGLKSKLATANSSLAEKKVSLERKEDEMRVLKQEKIMLTTELSESKREFHSMASVKNRLENDLEIMSSRLEMERTRIGEMQQDLNTRTQECKSLQLEMGKVLQELGYEKDLNMTLGKEHTSVKAKFLAANEQCENLQQRFQHLQMESKAKSQSNKEGMSKLEAELGQISQQCKTLKERQSKLETESAQYKDLLKKASGEVSETKAKLSMKTTALDTAIEYKEKVCKQLDAARRQLEISADTVANKETELQKCRAELSMHQSQLADALKENGRYKRQLNIERANGTKLQGDIGKLQETLTSLTVQMEQVKEEREYDRRRVEDLTNDVAMSQTKNHELTRDLHKALDELNEMQHESTEARTSFSRTIASLKSSHEEEQTSLQAENNGLRTELTQMKEKLCRKGLELDNCENRLGVCAGKLSSTDQKCIRLENSLKSQEEKFASLESRYINLESTHTAQSSDLNKRLKCQTAMSQQLRIHLESMEKECSALKEKLQVQREAAATSLNKIQKEHQANSTELHAKIRELSNNIEEAHDALRGTQQELSRVKTQNATLTSSISAETEKNRKLKEQFHDQMTALKLVEQNVEQLRVANEMEKTAKDRLKDSLSEENSRRRSCEITIEEQKKRIAIVTRDLTQCQNSLNKERAAMVNLNMETQNTCDELLRAKQQVDSLKQEMKKREMQGERELAALKQKYHGDKKSLKEKIKDLQTTQNCLTADCETRGAEVSRLQTSNQILAEDHMAALKKLSSLEHKLQDKREECGNLKVKLQAFEVQIRQLQSEVTTLEHGRLQLDELKKKSDAKSKIEMQRVLAEVTDHMEQQYSAHKYLEKLRTENEVIAIKEKEKTISQLKKELKQKKQDCKQDKVQLEQLQLETSFLKNQQMEQDRSRRRLEARLEQVNDTLSSSLPIKPVCSHSFQCLHPMDPQYTSTPTRTPKRSF